MTDLPAGRYLFVELGRKKASFEVDIQSPYDIEKAISPHLMSHNIDWNYDPKTNTGFVFAGWHVVGSFDRIGSIVDRNDGNVGDTAQGSGPDCSPSV